MKKAMNVMSIVALVLSSAAILFALAVLTVFWEPLAELLYGSIYSKGFDPVIPMSSMINMAIVFTFSLVFFLSKNSKGSMGAEITYIVVLCTYGLLLSVLNLFEVRFLSDVYTEDVHIARSMTTTLLSFPEILSGLASKLCLVIAGIRLSIKIMRKHRNVTL